MLPGGDGGSQETLTLVGPTCFSVRFSGVDATIAQHLQLIYRIVHVTLYIQRQRPCQKCVCVCVGGGGGVGIYEVHYIHSF